MDRVIDFYFDFISPYGYFAAMQIEEVAHRYNHTVRWHVFRVGVAVVKVMGLPPLMKTPLKRDYILNDVQRLATIYKIPVVTDVMSPDPVLLGSAFYAVQQENEHFLAKFTKHLYSRVWERGEQITERAQLWSEEYHDDLDIERVFSEPAMEAGRRRLSEATRAAITETGVFGSPTFLVGGEMIWGVDRLWMLEQYLRDRA